jgi:ParB-like chromosome segregation protein Spo0J
MAARDRVILSLRVDFIVPQAGRRLVDDEAVERIAASIREIGLQTPITVRSDPEGDDYFLVAGMHRLQAVKSLGHERIDCVVVEWNETEARLWEISENLHRAELSALERSEQIAEWVKLVSAKLAESPKGGRPGAVDAARRELGVSEGSARRAVKIASISSDAKAAADKAGLADNQSALLRVAAAPKERQAEIVHQIVAARQKTVSPAPEPYNDYEAYQAWLAEGVRWFNRGSTEWRELAREHLYSADVPSRRATA